MVTVTVTVRLRQGLRFMRLCDYARGLHYFTYKDSSPNQMTALEYTSNILVLPLLLGTDQVQHKRMGELMLRKVPGVEGSRGHLAQGWRRGRP